MKTNEEIEKFIKEEWFKNHIATYVRISDLKSDSVTEKIIWKDPKRSSYIVNYIRMDNYLIVTGDVGDAIYCTGFDTFKKWSECDVAYFSGICCSSEHGRQYMEWNPDYLTQCVKKTLFESNKNWRDFCEAGGDSALYNEQEWVSWLTLCGKDFWDDPRFYPFGKRISIRCHGHLIGLRMAITQLRYEVPPFTIKQHMSKNK